MTSQSPLAKIDPPSVERLLIEKKVTGGMFYLVSSSSPEAITHFLLVGCQSAPDWSSPWPTLASLPVWRLHRIWSPTQAIASSIALSPNNALEVSGSHQLCLVTALELAYWSNLITLPSSLPHSSPPPPPFIPPLPLLLSKPNSQTVNDFQFQVPSGPNRKVVDWLQGGLTFRTTSCTLENKS